MSRRLYRRSDSPQWCYTNGTGRNRVMRSIGTANKRIAELIQKAVQKISEENSGLKLDLHSLRHSFNTQLRDLGLGYEDWKALFGHKATSRVTSDYTHENVDLLRGYIDQL